MGGLAAAGAAAAPESKRVVGGTEADPADWPSVAALAVRGTQFCGASVIAPKAVLTAGHCVVGHDFAFRVITQRYDLTTGDGQSIKAKRVFVHPDYRRAGKHDLAVVRLRRETNAPTIPLATEAEDQIETAPGAKLRVAGWGDTEPDGQSASDVLMTTPQNVIAAHACRQAFAAFRPKSEICTRGDPVSGDGYTSSCYGDSGGPLVADPAAGDLLVGVVSYGGRRCGVRKPSVYARVADGLHFIRNRAGLSP